MILLIITSNFSLKYIYIYYFSRQIFYLFYLNKCEHFYIKKSNHAKQVKIRDDFRALYKFLSITLKAYFNDANVKPKD